MEFNSLRALFAPVARSNIHGAPYATTAENYAHFGLDRCKWREICSFNTNELGRTTLHNTSQNRPFGVSVIGCVERFA